MDALDLVTYPVKAESIIAFYISLKSKDLYPMIERVDQPFSMDGPKIHTTRSLSQICVLSSAQPLLRVIFVNRCSALKAARIFQVLAQHLHCCLRTFCN